MDQLAECLLHSSAFCFYRAPPLFSFVLLSSMHSVWPARLVNICVLSLIKKIGNCHWGGRRSRSGPSVQVYTRHFCNAVFAGGSSSVDSKLMSDIFKSRSST